MKFLPQIGSARKAKRPFFYGWVIVAVSFISLSLVWGARSSFSVFYVAILKEFGWSRGSTAFIFSLFIFMYGLISLLSGWLFDRFGPRKVIAIGAIALAIGMLSCSGAEEIWQLYFFWGFVGAMGVSLAGYVPHAAVVSKWFARKRGLALGIISSGLGFGALLIVFVQGLIDLAGWRWAYRIMGLIVIGVILPLAAIFQRAKAEDLGLRPDGECQEPAQASSPSQIHHLMKDPEWRSQDWTLWRALKSYRFWALFSCFFCFHGVAIGFLLAHQVALAVDVGYSLIQAAAIYSLYGVTQTIGQSLGFLGDRIGWERSYSLASLLAFLGILSIFTVRDTSQPWLLYSYGILLGFGAGLMHPAATGAAADLFQGSHFGSIFGGITFGFGIGGALSSWLGGYLFDKTGSYHISLILAMVAIFMALGSMWLAAPRKCLLPSEAHFSKSI